MKNKLKFFGKILALLILSSLIHFLPNWFNFSWIKFFAPTSESIFQHERILFVAYLIYSLFEYFIVYKSSGYWTSRFLILLILPWTMIMVYLLPQSFVGKMPNKSLEVFLAIVATAAVWLLVVPLEKDLERVKYSQIFSAIIIFLFFILFLSNIVFTLNLPVYDIFAEPVASY